MLIKKSTLLATLFFCLMMALPQAVFAANYVFQTGIGTVHEGSHHLSAGTLFSLDVYSKSEQKQYWQGGIAYSKYDITYFGVPFGSLSGGAFSTAELKTYEEQLDYYVYSSLPFFDTRFNWQIGYRGTLLDNEFSAFHMGGPLVGIEGQSDFAQGVWFYAVEFSPNFLNQVDNRGGSFYTFAGSKSISIYGDPLFSMHYSAWWWSPWLESFDLALGYSGEAIIFEGTDRYYNYLGLAARF